MCDTMQIKEAPYSALTIANYVVGYAYERKHSLRQFMTNLRLNKILYFIQAQFICKVGYPCFKDDLIAWKLGPTVPIVYNQFSMFSGSKIIPYPADVSEAKSTIAPKDQDQIIRIINMLDVYPTHKLVNISRDQLPWLNAAYTLSRVIKLTDMYKCFNEIRYEIK